MADLNDIAVFVRVAQFESFSRAAPLDSAAMTTAAATAVKGPRSGGGLPASSTSTGDLLCPLYVDSSRPLRAK